MGATLDGKETPLERVAALGQSVWIDYLSREMIRGGHLQELIDRWAVSGATSNPTIFDQAIEGSKAYDPAIEKLGREGLDAEACFWELAKEDIRDACDLFAPIFERTAAKDGFVSLEVNPHLAYDTLATYNAALELHEQVDRPNLLVKIPATKPGLAAIEEVIAAGRSVNVTLIFSLTRYDAVVESYIRGLERLVAEGGDPSKVHSVASFFVSRIDTEADRRLAELGRSDLQGKLAVANAKLAYQHYKERFSSPRWAELERKGASRQRVLWASTSTKNPAYSDVLYVEELIGPETVNTMPEETLRAYQDHGQPALRLEEGVEEARALFEELAAAGLDYDDVTETLEREGVEKFEASYDRLLETLRRKLGALSPA